MKSPFCYINLHSWKYTKEKHNVIGHPSGRDVIRVLVRECKFCGHREHHLLPRIEGKLTEWESFDHIDKNSTVEFKQL
jgi:hypothetical protein